MRQVALVGIHKQAGVAHRKVKHDVVQLLRSLAYSLAIVAVDNVDEALRANQVVAPQWANAVLPAHIPHAEALPLVFPLLRVEVQGWRCRDVLSHSLFTAFDFEQHGSLAR